MNEPVLVVVGSGLAGLSAALELAEQGARVVILEKELRLGGNSTKASSGMNALTTEGGDTVVDYERDVLKSGGDLSNPELVQVLIQDSVSALEFVTKFGTDLSATVRLGGHSHPRTHRNPKGPNVGFAIMKPLMDRAQAHPSITVRTSCKVSKLLGNAEVNAVEFFDASSGHAETLTAAAVIICTGGFSASQEALRRWAPQHVGLPTTNGPYAAGDGLLVAESLGAELVDIDQVQIHPTGFVDPACPDAPTKFLAPEALRGCGAVLLDTAGARFSDELTTRDAVVSAMSAAKSPVWLALPASGAAAFGVHALEFYCAKGLMSKAETPAAAAAVMNIPADTLVKELADYNACVQGGKPDRFGKTVFPATFEMQEPVWIAQVTPVVHYCMGGIRTSVDGEALRPSQPAVQPPRVQQGGPPAAISPKATQQHANQGLEPIPGLYAAGEASGGLHGRNRLAGNSLLECVVFGRRAAKAAFKYAQSRSQAVPFRGEAAA